MLIDMYAKFGLLETTQVGFLDHVPAQFVVPWNAMFTGYYTEFHNCDKVFFYFNFMIKLLGSGICEKDIMLGKAWVDMYVNCGMLEKITFRCKG